MARLFHWVLIAMLCGCGTNVAALLEAESELAWQVEQTLSIAAARAPGMGDAVYAAEAAKLDACDPLYAGFRQRLLPRQPGTQTGLAKRFWLDLQILTALLLPIEAVERCWMAYRDYEKEHEILRQRLTGMTDDPVGAE